jgi:hypothetical protein
VFCKILMQISSDLQAKYFFHVFRKLMQLSSNLQAIFFLHVFCKLMQISSNLQEAKKFSICGLKKSDATQMSSKS